MKKVLMLEEAITNTGTSIKYTSDNPSVATVYLTTGEVSLVSVGTAIITATANEQIIIIKQVLL